MLEAHSGGSTLRLFEAQGGVEESFGAQSETNRSGTKTRFCVPASVNTPTWVDHSTPRSQLVSLVDLQMLGVAADLPKEPDFPQERQSPWRPNVR